MGKDGCDNETEGIVMTLADYIENKPVLKTQRLVRFLKSAALPGKV